jgi:NAD(P)H-hydrate repair Nnr-like enzyme with NAD(P)H-hydrate epimerase domain
MKTQNTPISSREMRALEANAEYFGLDLLQLMELAGRNVAQEVMLGFQRARA